MPSGPVDELFGTLLSALSYSCCPSGATKLSGPPTSGWQISSSKENPLSGFGKGPKILRATKIGPSRAFELNLKLLQADKEGGFVLAPTTVYKEKADAAVTENFQVANVKPSKVKATASKLCEEAGLQKLASSVRAARGVNLSVFFSAKTHKPEVPFRVIVSEQGTWQRLVGRDADVVGVSTSNTTDESNIILGRAGGNVSPYKAASPPNPLNAVAPGTRGMLDILGEFPRWKQVLNRQSLCFSLTTSINYMRSSADPIDFVSEVHNDPDVQRFGRLRFTTRGSNNKYPVEDLQTIYHFDNTTYSHFWRYIRNGDLLTLFAYDTGPTLSYKLNQMLSAYGKDKCVVLDDLSDDNVERNFTYRGQTVHFGKFEILTAVQSLMTRLYGGPFP
nr:uncharacterized protein LOC119177831 [Rhipicephalus microplus]